MVAATRRLLSQDGAKFHARIEPSGYNQVSLVMQVRLDDQREPEQAMRTTDAATAHKLAKRFAEEAGFGTVIWEGEFCASVVYAGNAYQGSWCIRSGNYELEADSTLYPTEETARVMVKGDARRLGYEGRIKWEDRYTE
jgi:hypothetical protein